MYGDKETCAECAHCYTEKTIELRPSFLCRRFPPSVTHVPIMGPGGAIAGQASLTGYPKVSAGWTCGEWAPGRLALKVTKVAA